jgi:3-ketosteroid 9alpha-monooxygenase subunit A
MDDPRWRKGVMNSITPQMMKPTGWFQIGWTGDYPNGEVRPRHFFGEELVVYRTEEGNLHALDAFCRHMGAHLGFGGTVCGERIVCPFHGWEWSAEGENVKIPDEERTNRGRRLRAWPISERNGVVYLWHDSNDEGPSWDVPDLFASFGADVQSREYHAPEPNGIVRCGVLRLSPYVVLDNVGDMGHFRTVHGTHDAPTVLTHGPDAHRFLLRLGFGQSWKTQGTDPRPTGDVLDIVQFGVGFSYSVLGGPKLPYVVIVLSTTPVDEHSSEMFQTVWLERTSRDEEDGRLEKRMHYACHQLPRDITIWEHQRYEPNPAWSASEVPPFRAIREWAKAFYEASPA